MRKFSPSVKALVATASLLFPIICHSGPTQILRPKHFNEPIANTQQIDIERTLGDPTPRWLTICIDGQEVASMQQGERVRVYLSPTRTHDLYIVTKGNPNCDVNQVVTVLEIPTEKPIWKVGVERDDTIRLVDSVNR